MMKCALSLLSLLLIGIFSFAQTDQVGSFSPPAHPRILWFKGDEATVKKMIASDKTWSSLQQAVLAESDNLLTIPPVERIKIGRRLLDKSREALRRLFFLSYAYRMTQQSK